MKRESGFSLVEVLVATALMVIILGTTVGTLTTAINTTQGIGLLADTQENLRAGMNYMVRDLLQAGEGVPQTGLVIPNTSGASAVTRPGPYTAPATSFGTFNTTWTALPAITTGYRLGPTTTTSGVATDMVTILYADTTLQDSNGHWLNEFPIYLAPASGGVAGCASSNPNPAPAGSISASATTVTVTFDKSCIVINNGNTGLNPGDLIMLQNNNTVGDGSVTGTDTDVSDTSSSMALLCVSSVNSASNSVTFSAGDPFGLNDSGQTTGTIVQMELSPAGSGKFPTTTATRFWMITYYIDNTNPQRPQLMREVNLNPPQAVGEVIENLQLFYDILTSGPTTIPATVVAEQESPTDAQLPYIRDAYIAMFARSETTFARTGQYFRNNLETVVSIRGLDFYNQFQ